MNSNAHEDNRKPHSGPTEKKKGFAVDTKALDGLRGICILHIAVSHFVVYPYPNVDLLADISVTAFLVLSGFVLAVCYGKRKLTSRAAHWAFIKEFYTKRFARLFPAWIIGILFGLVMGVRLLQPHSPFPASSFLVNEDVSFNTTTNSTTGYFCRYSWEMAPKPFICWNATQQYHPNELTDDYFLIDDSVKTQKFVNDVLLLSPWLAGETGGYPFNPPMWTISLLLFFYFFFPILLPFFQQRKHKLLWCFMCYIIQGLLWGAGYAIGESGDEPYLFARMFPPFRIFVFFLGMFAGLARLEQSQAMSLSQTQSQTLSQTPLVVVRKDIESGNKSSPSPEQSIDDLQKQKIELFENENEKEHDGNTTVGAEELAIDKVEEGGNTAMKPPPPVIDNHKSVLEIVQSIGVAMESSFQYMIGQHVDALFYCTGTSPFYAGVMEIVLSLGFLTIVILGIVFSYLEHFPPRLRLYTEVITAMPYALYFYTLTQAPTLNTAPYSLFYRPVYLNSVLCIIGCDLSLMIYVLHFPMIFVMQYWDSGGDYAAIHFIRPRPNYGRSIHPAMSITLIGTWLLLTLAASYACHHGVSSVMKNCIRDHFLPSPATGTAVAVAGTTNKASMSDDAHKLPAERSSSWFNRKTTKVYVMNSK